LEDQEPIENDDGTFCCASCGALKNVYAQEQLNDEEKVIGILFICNDCVDMMNEKNICVGFIDMDENAFIDDDPCTCGNCNKDDDFTSNVSNKSKLLH